MGVKINVLKRFNIILYSVIAICSINAFSSVKHDHNSLYLFGGFGAGYTRIDSNVRGEAPNKDGYMVGVRLIGSYSYDRFSISSGFGYFRNKYESEFIDNQKVTLLTKMAFLEVNPLYRFTHRHSAGIIWNHTMGEQLRVAPSYINGSINSDSRTKNILGVNYYYSIPWKNWRMRLGLQLMKPLEIGDRSGFTGILTVQLGFPVVKNFRQSLIHRERTEESVYNVTLKTQRINFETDSAEPRPASKKFLKKLGKFLRDNPKLWTKLSIEGHTDSVGSANYNQGLSIERARSVTHELVNAGASRDWIFFEGYGEERLLDKRKTAEAHKRNRRVELHFVGKTDIKKIQKFFDQ